MHSEITTLYSWWYLPLIAVISAALSWFLYYKDEKLAGLSPIKLNLLRILRFLSFFSIAVFLLSIVFKSVKIKIEKPLVVFVQDNSASLKSTFDNQAFKTDYINQLTELLSGLEDEYQVQRYSFGEQLSDSLSFDFVGRETDFSSMIEAINKRYATANMGALIIASDGLYNRGVNPVYAVRNLTYPVYTIALGDTARKKDIVLQDVFSNPIAFSGDRFPLELQISASGFKNTQTRLQVYNQSKLLIDNPLSINSGDFFRKITLYLDADGKGLQNYKISIVPVKGEYTTKNNVKNVAVDIISDKKRILILSGAPHPDIAAMRRALESNKNIITDYAAVETFKNKISDYHLVVFYQLPDRKYSLNNILLQIKKQKIPAIFVLGSQTNISTFNNLKLGLKISQNRNMTEYVSAYFNKQFNLFETKSMQLLDFHNFPPLTAPFGEYALERPADVLLFQQIKGVKTQKPLIFLFPSGQNGIVRSGYICAENFWQWRMRDYLENGSFEHFDALINRLVHYLSLDVKKDRFIVRAKRVFKENETVILRADYYNKSYELNNQPELVLELSDKENNKFNYVFSRNANAYVLDIGQLPVGSYAYKAELNDGAVKFVKTGEFMVIPVNIELVNTQADYSLMYKIAAETGAKMFVPDSINRILNTVKENPNIKPVSFSTHKLLDLIELKWLFFVIIALLAAEWFLRKFFGSY